MEFYGKNHVFEYAPAALDNREQSVDDMMFIGLKCVTMPEQDKFQREMAAVRNDYALDKAQEVIEQKTYEMVKSKVCFIKNCIIDGQLVEDWDTFYANAPMEIVSEICAAVLRTNKLMEGERKNFLSA